MFYNTQLEAASTQNNSIFDIYGNIASTNQTNNTIYLNNKNSPYITSTTISEDNLFVEISFNSGTDDTNVYNSWSKENGPIGDLSIYNFYFTLIGGNASLNSKIPTSIFFNKSKYKIGIPINGIPNGRELLTIHTKNIFNSSGIKSLELQNYNSINLIDKTVPIIELINVSNDSI